MISVPVDDDHFLLSEAHGPQHKNHHGFERLGWLARRIAEVLKPGDRWRNTSPSPGFDATQRNLIAFDLAAKGALVLHLEPSGRSLVYRGKGVQSTRSLPYLRRLLEGGLGLLSAPETLPREHSRAPSRWGLPLGLSLAASGAIALFSRIGLAGLAKRRPLQMALLVAGVIVMAVLASLILAVLG